MALVLLTQMTQILKWKQRMQEIRGWQAKIMNSFWNFPHRNKMLEIAYESQVHGFYFFTLTATWDG